MFTRRSKCCQVTQVFLSLYDHVDWLMMKLSDNGFFLTSCEAVYDAMRHLEPPVRRRMLSNTKEITLFPQVRFGIRLTSSAIWKKKRKVEFSQIIKPEVNSKVIRKKKPDSEPQLIVPEFHETLIR